MRASTIRQVGTSAARAVQQQSLQSHGAVYPNLEYIAHPEFVKRNLTEEEAAVAAPGLPSEGDGTPAVRRSQAALDGSSRIGMVVLPLELQMAVDRLIERGDKPLLRQRALQLYEYFRGSASLSTASKGRKPKAAGSDATAGPTEKIASKPFLDGTTALAYTAGVMPGIYAATTAVLAEARRRFDMLDEDGLDAWRPRRVVDWGAGTASAAWATKEIWPETSLSYVGLDSSRAMQTISAALLAQIPPHALSTKLHQTSLGAPDIQEIIKNSSIDIPDSETLAITAFTLGDLPTDKVRRETVRAMWDSGAEVIVIIDRGTPKGFDIVANARDQLLRLGRHTNARSSSGALQDGAVQKSADVVEEHEDSLTIGGETFFAEESEDSGTTQLATPTDNRGSWIVAPCPHDGVCPLHKTRNFCHFSQKLQRPAALRKTKHSTMNEEGAAYSYVIVKRGERPSNDDKRPRLIVSPLKRGGHVILDACCPTEKIERFTIAKSTGKQEYYDARKSRWGETFPHWDPAHSTEKTVGLRR